MIKGLFFSVVNILTDLVPLQRVGRVESAGPVRRPPGTIALFTLLIEVRFPDNTALHVFNWKLIQ